MDKSDDVLEYKNDWLLVFMDETGHEAFAGDQPYFAIGGCAMLGSDIATVQAEWKELRRKINGDAEAPLHAADLEYNQENFSSISDFFASRAFARFGVALSSKTNFNVDMHNIAPVMGLVKEYIARIASILPCREVALIFESSQRGDPLIKTNFGELNLTENDTSLLMHHCFMPKSAKEPLLEVADFVASASGSQAKFYYRDKKRFAQDYKAVFHRLSPPFSQFFHITEVGGSQIEQTAWVKGVRRDK